MTKDELTVELALRFAVALRAPGMVTSSGMTKFTAANGYESADMDRKLARYIVAMSREFAEEIHRNVHQAPPAPPKPSSSAIEPPGPDDDLEKTRIRY